MDREFPGCPFERYADDIVAHCDSEEQARALRAAIAERLGALGLELHPEKTKIVFCKDANRPGSFEHISFDFLGYTFRGRLAQGPRGYFAGFSPAISGKAKKANGRQIRAWHLNRRSGTDLSGLAEEINPQVRGWINYYGAFYRSELRFLAWRINEHLARWAMHKFKRFRGKYARQWSGCNRCTSTSPTSSPTGNSSRSPQAGLWGPDDGRLSRPVLRAAGGEIPPADSRVEVGPHGHLRCHERMFCSFQSLSRSCA